MTLPRLPRVLQGYEPLVLLDSGRSVDESVYNQLVYKTIREKLGRSRTYLFHPPNTPKGWYDLPPSGEYDYWQRRPIRAEGRKLEANGMLQTAAIFETACIFKREGGQAPWRNEYTGVNSCATFVYLNPTKRDLDFAKWHHKQFWNYHGISKFILGDSVKGKMPMGYSAFVDWVLAYGPERASYFRNLNGKHIGRHLNTQALLRPKSAQEEVVLAGNHGNRFRQRHPEMLQSWLEMKGIPSRVHDSSSGEAFLSGLKGRYYCVFSRQEGNPFDILLAQARGMVPVLPDIPLFRRLELERAIYYPASSDGDFGIKMNTLDARTWFHNAFRSGRLKSPTPQANADYHTNPKHPAV